jgi:hypothetical protein
MCSCENDSGNLTSVAPLPKERKDEGLNKDGPTEERRKVFNPSAEIAGSPRLLC